MDLEGFCKWRRWYVLSAYRASGAEICQSTDEPNSIHKSNCSSVIHTDQHLDPLLKPHLASKKATRENIGIGCYWAASKGFETTPPQLERSGSRTLASCTDALCGSIRAIIIVVLRDKQRSIRGGIFEQIVLLQALWRNSRRVQIIEDMRVSSLKSGLATPGAVPSGSARLRATRCVSSAGQLFGHSDTFHRDGMDGPVPPSPDDRAATREIRRKC